MRPTNEPLPDAEQILGLDVTDLRRARWECQVYAIPAYVYRAWQSHKASATSRGIPFRFGVLQWHLWWLEALAKHGPNARRGLRRGEFMMCRHGDAGAYEPGNVFAGTAADNQRDMPDAARQIRFERAQDRRKINGTQLGKHLKVRGDGHPRSMAVITPMGRFGSIALASEAHGFSRVTGMNRVRSGQWQRVAPP